MIPGAGTLCLMISLPFRCFPTWLSPGLSLAIGLAAVSSAGAEGDDEYPAKGIQDNSFFIEEAYNQEPGVVQHILNITGTVTQGAGADDKEWSFVFTQEWPMGTQTHQFSYTLPYFFRETGGQSSDAMGDVLINYRFQALRETSCRPACAPRLSLISPTGDKTHDFGNGVVGYQFNVPVSKIVSERWTLHANAGLTFLPDVQGSDLINYNVGGSAIVALSRNLNLMLECLANFEEEPGEGHATSVIVSPGVRYAFNFKNNAQLVIGLAAPIGITGAAPDYGAFLYCSFEHFFAR